MAFSGDISTIPESIRIIIDDCRSAISADEIDLIELFYVHNLPESVNVARELQTAEEHVRRVLGSRSIAVKATEMGMHRIQHLHDAQQSHIEVRDEIDFPADFSFREEGPKWRAYVASVPGIWLHTLYTKYSDSLFSANYRGFLGKGRRRGVNSGIQESAETRSADFWAFNNGITILTAGVKQAKSGRQTLSGISIINGAQTTGSIGSVDISRRPIQNLKVLCRVIESSDAETIDNIVKYNNTQNAFKTWDQYSNDPEQKRLSQEFKELGFSYNIKRGFLGTGDELSIDELIQPLLAFHGRAQDAVRGKNTIFDRKQLYQNAFEGKKARHALFVYTLSKAIDGKRLLLKAKSDDGTLIALEQEQLALMRNLRFKPFFMSLMASTIETALGKRCDAQIVAFSPEAVRGQSLVELTARWTPVVETLLALVTASPEAKDFASRLSDDQYIPSLSRQINALLHAMGAAQKHAAFSELVMGT